MALKISRRGTIPPFIVMDVLRAANEREAAGEDVLHLEVGQPGTPAPAPVLAAARRALEEDRIGYTDALGLPALRDRIARFYEDRHGVRLARERVVVTTGSSAGFVLSFLSAFDLGDRVALASPGYPAYRNILNAVGIEVVEVPVGQATNFQPTPALLDGAAGDGGAPLDGLIIASPANPTGTMIHAEDLAALIAYCRDHGIRLISDEIYHGITYAEPAQTALRHTDDAIVVNSFSKYFSMTGWRIGWMVVPDDLLRSVECLAQNLFISPPTLSQYAAIAAFDCEDALDAIVGRYADNRALLLEQLPAAGFEDLAPAEGAFYIYANIAGLTNDSEAFCKRMLAETGVAATPGVDFDPQRGTQFMRFSFAEDFDVIAQAAERLRQWRR